MTRTIENINTIPAELRERRQWVLWKYIDGRKTPFQPNGQTAKSNDPATWSDFDTIVGAGGYEGIGFVLSNDDPYVGVDLDSCRDAETGELAPWAEAIVTKLASYCEVSPSGTGVKLTLTGTKPQGSRCVYDIANATPTDFKKKPQVEIYEKGRFWAFTGEIYRFSEIASRSAELVKVIQSITPEPNKPRANASPVGDDALLAAAQRYVDGAENCSQGGRNRAAFSLAGHLGAFVTQDGRRLSEVQIAELMAGWNNRNGPPLDEAELMTTVQSALNSGTPRDDKVVEDRRTTRKPASKRPPDLLDIASDAGKTDIANAERFVQRFRREILYIPQWGRWLAWDGSRWADDSGMGVQQRATRYAVSLWEKIPTLAPELSEAELNAVVSFIRATNQAPKIQAFLKLAQSHPAVVCPVEDLNADPMLLNVVNGTIDLATGQLRPHAPEDRITQIAKVAYDPNAECPKWLEMLNLIFNGDQELMRYVQRLLGYSLSGSTGEHILPIAYGSGFNGKSTIWSVVSELLGEYATLASEELLMGDKNGHPTEKAALYQKRFVAISEPERNTKLRESRVKELTGDKLITARRMKEDFWSFTRTHTFWISSNHLPRISGVDEGIWRRVKLIPFTVDLRDKVDPIPDFDSWLVRHEGRGILAWMVRGFLEYQENGLGEPTAVTKATGDYRSDSDALGEFIAEHCVVDPDGEATAAELFKAYTELFGGGWKQTTFGRAMAERFPKTRANRGENRGKWVYAGIRLNTGNYEGCDEVRRVAPSLAVNPKDSPSRRDQPPNPAQLGATALFTTDDTDRGVEF